jgi:hypothetical protein
VLVDLESQLKSLAPKPTKEPDIDRAWRKGRRLRLQRRAAASVLSAIAILALILGVSRWVDFRSQPDAQTVGPIDEGVKPKRIEQLAWPQPFVPPTHTSFGLTDMTVVFPDRTVVEFSYPTQLDLASLGVQPTYSYSFKRSFKRPRPNRPGSPYEVIFVHGDIPGGLLDPPSLGTFQGTVGEATLHKVKAKGLRPGANYALVFRLGNWNLVATVPSESVASSVAEHLFPSVNKDGWPALVGTGPVRMSVGFGEPRGPQLEIGDGNPSFEMVALGANHGYITMGLQRCSSQNNRRWGASAFKCLHLGNGIDVVVSIAGPKRFVNATFDGLEIGSKSP